MTTETILTDERLIEMAANELQEHFDRLPNSIFLLFARAIEQDVLQSPEIQALRNALATLAEDDEAGLYESEYDGRMYTLCQHCSYQDDVRPQHDESCPIMRARSALAAMEQQK